MLRSGFMPVNIDHPGLRIMNIDPPVLTIDEFLPAATCDALVAAAAATGSLAPSKVGGAGDVPADMRTSSTLAITQSALKQHPALQQPLEQLLSAAARLVALGTDGQQLMARLCTPPSSSSQICPELPQVARYQPGEMGGGTRVLPWMRRGAGRSCPMQAHSWGGCPSPLERPLMQHGTTDCICRRIPSSLASALYAPAPPSRPCYLMPAHHFPPQPPHAPCYMPVALHCVTTLCMLCHSAWLQASTSWRTRMGSRPRSRSKKATSGAPPCWCT